MGDEKSPVGQIVGPPGWHFGPRLEAVGDLLGHQIAAVSDPAVQRHRSEVRAAFPLAFRPANYLRGQLAERDAEQPEKAKIAPHGAKIS